MVGLSLKVYGIAGAAGLHCIQRPEEIQRRAGTPFHRPVREASRLPG